MPSYAAVLRDIANEHEASCRDARGFDMPTCPACQRGATQLRALADLLARVTPQVVDATIRAEGWAFGDAEPLGDAGAILRALAAGPQPEEATGTEAQFYRCEHGIAPFACTCGRSIIVKCTDEWHIATGSGATTCVCGKGMRAGPQPGDGSND